MINTELCISFQGRFHLKYEGIVEIFETFVERLSFVRKKTEILNHI